VLSPGDTYRVAKGGASSRTEIRFFSKKAPTAFVFWRQGENSGSDTLAIKYDKRVVNAKGRIRGSLVESISKAVGDDLIAYRFMDAFILDYNLPKVLQKNAPFSITYEKLYDAGQFVRYGEVLRAEIEINGENVVRDFRTLKKGGIFLNAKNDHSSRPFYSPVDYISISSLFQPRRFHPIKKYRRAHEGIDFELQEGAPVYSVSEGTILRIGRNRAAGNFVVVRHANGYESYYNHLSFLARLYPGSRIDTGTQLGGIGCTGYCTKPHLHFAIKRHGRFINPISLLRSYSYGQRHDVGRLLARYDD
jgi:murein DD-endopeptidase MepM/ murein hydrolase activator NlpD